MDDTTFLNGIIRKRDDGRTTLNIPKPNQLEKDTPVKVFIIKDTVQDVDTYSYSDNWKEKEQEALDYLSHNQSRFVNLYELAYELGLTKECTKKLMNKIWILKGTISIRNGDTFSYKKN